MSLSADDSDDDGDEVACLDDDDDDDDEGAGGGDLDDGGWVMSLCEQKGWTPLHRAARNGNTDAIRALLECGADVAVKAARSNATPLTLAERRKKDKAAQLLRAAGAT